MGMKEKYYELPWEKTGNGKQKKLSFFSKQMPILMS